MSPRIMCHQHSISDEERELMTNKVARLKKFYNRIHEVSIILDAERHTKQAEILLRGPQLNLRVLGEGENMRTAFESAINKAERWLRKTKEKLWGDKMHRRRNVTIRRFDVGGALPERPSFIDENVETSEPIDVERLEPQIMSIDEARAHMEKHEGIFVFVNAETQETNILHRNKNHRLELLEIGEPIQEESLEGSAEAIG